MRGTPAGASVPLRSSVRRIRSARAGCDPRQGAHDRVQESPERQNQPASTHAAPCPLCTRVGNGGKCGLARLVRQREQGDRSGGRQPSDDIPAAVMAVWQDGDRLIGFGGGGLTEGRARSYLKDLQRVTRSEWDTVVDELTEPPPPPTPTWATPSRSTRRCFPGGHSCSGPPGRSPSRRSSARFSTLEAICEVLDCQPGDLLGREP